MQKKIQADDLLQTEQEPNPNSAIVKRIKRQRRTTVQNESGRHKDSSKVSRITDGKKDENEEVYGCTGTSVNATAEADEADEAAAEKAAS